MEKDIRLALKQQVLPENTSRYGLVVGIDRYADPRISDLGYARADAEAVYNLMTDPECGMFEPGKVYQLFDQEATKRAVSKRLSRLHKKAKEEDTVWIYYSGHGAPDADTGATCWILHDTELDDIEVTSLPNRDIRRYIGLIEANTVVSFLDCCHAADCVQEALGQKSILTDPEKLFKQFTGEGRLTICSSDGTEKSVELADRGHGAFTYYLVEGLRGGADVDGNGVVEADELWKFLDRKVTDAARERNNPQTPKLISSISHHLPLTLNPIATAEKQRWAEAVTRNVSYDGLSNEEADHCLRILRWGPATDADREVAEQFEALADGTMEIAIFRKYVRLAMIEGGPTAPPRPLDWRRKQNRIGAALAKIRSGVKNVARALGYGIRKLWSLLAAGFGRLRSWSAGRPVAALAMFSSSAVVLWCAFRLLGPIGLPLGIAVVSTALWIAQAIDARIKRFGSLWEDARKCSQAGRDEQALELYRECRSASLWPFTLPREDIDEKAFDIDYRLNYRDDLQSHMSQGELGELVSQLEDLFDRYPRVSLAVRELRRWRNRIAAQLAKALAPLKGSRCPVTAAEAGRVATYAKQLEGHADSLVLELDRSTIQKLIVARSFILLDQNLRKGTCKAVDRACQAYSALQRRWASDQTDLGQWARTILRVRRSGIETTMCERIDRAALHEAKRYLTVAENRMKALGLQSLCRVQQQLMEGRTHLQNGRSKQALDCFGTTAKGDVDERRQDTIARWIHRAEFCAAMCYFPGVPQEDVAAFYVDPKLVTRKEYLLFLDVERPAEVVAQLAKWGLTQPVDPGCLGCPATTTSLKQARLFASHMGKRLPSAREWEMAAGWDFSTERLRQYPWGDVYDERCVAYQPDPLTGSAERSNQSPIGCFDMAGRFWQWVIPTSSVDGSLRAMERGALKGGCSLSTDKEVECQVSCQRDLTFNLDPETTAIRCVISADAGIRA